MPIRGVFDGGQFLRVLLVEHDGPFRDTEAASSTGAATLGAVAAGGELDDLAEDGLGGHRVTELLTGLGFHHLLDHPRPWRRTNAAQRLWARSSVEVGDHHLGGVVTAGAHHAAAGVGART